MKKKLGELILWTFGISGFTLMLSAALIVGSIIGLFLIVENPELLLAFLPIILIIWTFLGTTVFFALIAEIRES